MDRPTPDDLARHAPTYDGGRWLLYQFEQEAYRVVTDDDLEALIRATWWHLQNGGVVDHGRAGNPEIIAQVFGDDRG